MVLIQYRSNNSGGHFWISEEDWKNLEKAGWVIKWIWESWAWDEENKIILDENGLPKKEQRLDYDGKPMKVGSLFCGTKAMYAVKDFNSIEEAIEEFESITGQDVYNLGCDCCGPPHSFCEFIY